jgi:hypothetical protein
MNSNEQTGMNRSLASTSFTAGELSFALIKGNGGVTATVTGFACDVIADLTILPTVSFEGKTYPVTAIDYRAFSGCSGLKSLTLFEGLVEIGDYAFYECRGLTGELTFPESLVEIGDAAFNDCRSLTSLTLPDGLTEIGDDAFYGCNDLTSLTFPASLTAIGERAFSCCSGLISVTLLSITPPELGAMAFDEVTIASKFFTTPFGCKFTCPKGCLEAYQADEAWEEFFVHGSESTTDQPIYSITFDNLGLRFVLVKSNGVTTATVTGFAGDVIAALTIPATVKYEGISYPVTAVGSFAFHHRSGLKSLTFPESLVKIGRSAFHSCSGLTGSLMFPENLIQIGNSAFRSCSGLTSLKFPKGLTKIGNMAFDSCSGVTGSLTFPKSLIQIGFNAFDCCRGLTSLTFLSITPPDLISWAFNGVSKDCKFICPNEKSIDVYQAAVRNNFGVLSRGPYISINLNGVRQIRFQSQESER